MCKEEEAEEEAEDVKMILLVEESIVLYKE